MTRTAWGVVALCLLSATGCDCSGTINPGGDGGGLDGTAGTDGGIHVDATGLDGGGTTVDGGCGGACGNTACACSIGADCCSGNCDGNLCVPAGCMPQGSTCGVNEDCCTLFCDAGTCAVRPRPCDAIGASCATAADCCSGNCAGTDSRPCAGTGDCTCGASTGCFPAAMPCTSDDQCCNHLCDRPGGGAGHCASLGACRVAGEPCGTAGFDGSCCSTVCLDTTGTGARCQFLGGCRVQDELCSNDGECCSGVCATDGMTVDGRPIRRCANATSCLPAGEVCGGAGASSNCCPNGGGDTGCMATGAGFRRCFGGSPGCGVLPSLECTPGDPDPCCTDTFPNVMCQPGRDGITNVCCLSQGEACAFGDVCCCGVCAPDDGGNLVCCPSSTSCTPDGDSCTMASQCCSGSCTNPAGNPCPAGATDCTCGITTCVADGGACTIDSDCCEPDCCRADSTGAFTCTTDCGVACTDGQLGDLCSTAMPCCAPLVCNTAVEFPTCALP